MLCIAEVINEIGSMRYFKKKSWKFKRKFHLPSVPDDVTVCMRTKRTLLCEYNYQKMQFSLSLSHQVL